MEKDEMTPELREMMNIMLEMITPDDTEEGEQDLQTEDVTMDFPAFPEHRELYDKVCVFAKTQEQINEEMLEKVFEIGYGMAARIIDRMKDEGRISRERDEEYFYRTL